MGLGSPPKQMESDGPPEPGWKFEAKYTAERNFYLLKEIYEFAIQARSGSLYARMRLKRFPF